LKILHYKKNRIYLQQKSLCNEQNPYIIQNYLRITYGQKSVFNKGVGNLHTNFTYGFFRRSLHMNLNQYVSTKYFFLNYLLLQLLLLYFYYYTILFIIIRIIILLLLLITLTLLLIPKC